MSTAYTNAAARSARFDNITIAANKTYKLLDLTANSYYKITISNGTITVFAEIINNEIIVSSATTNNSCLKLVNNSLYFKLSAVDDNDNFIFIDYNFSIFIDYFEEFILSVGESTDIEMDEETTETETTDKIESGTVIRNIATNKVNSNETSLGTADITTLNVTTIEMSQWKFVSSVSDDGDAFINVSLKE